MTNKKDDFVGLFASSPSNIIEEMRREDLNPEAFHQFLITYEKFLVRGTKGIARDKCAIPQIEELVSKPQAFLAGSECLLEFINSFMDEYANYDSEKSE